MSSDKMSCFQSGVSVQVIEKRSKKQSQVQEAVTIQSTYDILLVSLSVNALLNWQGFGGGEGGEAALAWKSESYHWYYSKRTYPLSNVA